MHSSNAAPTRRLAIVLAALAAAGTLAAQEDDYTFFDTLDIHVVNDDVVVVGPDGKPVAGLTRDDFELLEDGEPVEISNFFSVDRAQPARLPLPESGDEAPGDEARMPQETALPPVEQQLHLALFIDGRVAGYRVVLQMRPTGHEVAVGVRDELGRVESTVTDSWRPAPPVG